jgi:hypothetical protein
MSLYQESHQQLQILKHLLQEQGVNVSDLSNQNGELSRPTDTKRPFLPGALPANTKVRCSAFEKDYTKDYEVLRTQ